MVQGSALCGFVVAVFCIAIAVGVKPQLGRDKRNESRTYVLVHDEIGMSATARWLQTIFGLAGETLILAVECGEDDLGFIIQTRARAVLVLVSPGVLWHPIAGAAITYALGNNAPLMLVSVDNASIGIPEDQLADLEELLKR